MRVIIAAAGTGGHIIPALDIADKIKKENPGSEILFIGTKRGLENKLVTKKGYELKHIEAYGLSKEISISNFKKILKTFLSRIDMIKIMKEFKPDVVIGTGGYICAPVFYAAQKLKIPNVFHESNAYPGKCLKLFSKKASKILLGFDSAKKYFAKTTNCVTVGNPIEEDMINLGEKEKDDIKEKMGLKKDLPIVLIFGGSQGATVINNSVIEMIKNKDISGFQIIWGTGNNLYDEVMEKLNEIDKKEIKENVHVLPYIYNMSEMYSIASLVVSRSGAMTVTNIASFGIPSIFIPYPSIGANRQIDNAKTLENIGAARIIINNDLNYTLLYDNIKELLGDEKNLRHMGEMAKTIATNGAIEKIYEEIKEVL